MQTDVSTTSVLNAARADEHDEKLQWCQAAQHPEGGRNLLVQENYSHQEDQDEHYRPHQFPRQEAAGLHKDPGRSHGCHPSPEQTLQTCFF